MNAPVASADAAPLILVVDDTEANRVLLVDLLELRGFRVATADCGSTALRLARQLRPDLMLLDVKMPDIDGFEVCRTLRADADFHTMPIVMITSLLHAREGKGERAKGLDAGADDFLGKPLVEVELFARVRSLLRVKSLHDQVARQRDALSQAAAGLQREVQDQVRQNQRLERLKRFVSPALAERLLGDQGDSLWASHRREITVLFADLRGFTAFAEAVDPGTLMSMLTEFYVSAGEAIDAHEGTLERFTGDGFMVFFNDPQKQADHTQRAIALSLEVLRLGALLEADWSARGFQLGLSVGVARGMATLGGIGCESRMDYAAIGRVTNRAARLCAKAGPAEVMVCRSAWDVLAAHERPAGVAGEELFVLKGLPEPVAAVRVVRVVRVVHK